MLPAVIALIAILAVYLVAKGRLGCTKDQFEWKDFLQMNIAADQLCRARYNGADVTDLVREKMLGDTLTLKWSELAEQGGEEGHALVVWYRGD